MHGLWVSSSESLSNPGVVELLSIAELHVADTTAEDGTEDESAEALVQVNVEVVRSRFLSAHEIGEGQPSAGKSESAGLDSSSELPVVIEVKEVQVEELWVVLDELNGSNLLAELGILLFNVVGVALDMWSVSSHF